MWLDREYEKAMKHLEADKENLARPELLYSLGLLARSCGLPGAARAHWRQVAREFPNSLWQIYANDALRKM